MAAMAVARSAGPLLRCAAASLTHSHTPFLTPSLPHCACLPRQAEVVNVLSRVVGRTTDAAVLDHCAAAIVRLTVGVAPPAAAGGGPAAAAAAAGLDGRLPPAVEALCRQWCETNMRRAT